jgi:hypothetical protein
MHPGLEPSLACPSLSRALASLMPPAESTEGMIEPNYTSTVQMYSLYMYVYMVRGPYGVVTNFCAYAAVDATL